MFNESSCSSSSSSETCSNDIEELSLYIGIEKEKENGASLSFEYPINLKIFVLALVLSSMDLMD